MLVLKGSSSSCICSTGTCSALRSLSKEMRFQREIKLSWNISVPEHTLQQQRDQSYEAIIVQSLLFSRAWKREKIAV